MMQKYLLNAGTLTDWRAGDFDENGKISSVDLSLMKQALLNG